LKLRIGVSTERSCDKVHIFMAFSLGHTTNVFN
jgi:hypothetical protein